MKSFLFRTLLIVTAGFVALPAMARISIAPTQIQLKPENGFGYITVSNQSMEAVEYQVQLPEQYKSRILVSPGKFSLKPSNSKIIRFKLKDPALLPEVEGQRVLLEQIVGKAPSGVVQIRMNFSLPIRKP
ncbi:MAG: hypothetical protein R3194_02905 [Limnobacter sp.]|nr:hypothetical protein [Limnobacter sp.]